jgi:hypothetical protein
MTGRPSDLDHDGRLPNELDHDYQPRQEVDQDDRQRQGLDQDASTLTDSSSTEGDVLCVFDRHGRVWTKAI